MEKFKTDLCYTLWKTQTQVHSMSWQQSLKLWLKLMGALISTVENNSVCWDLRLPHSLCCTLGPWPEWPREAGGHWVGSWMNFIRWELCVLQNHCAWQAKAQQREMTGRIPSKAQSNPSTNAVGCYDTHHSFCCWTAHEESWSCLLSPVLCALWGE